MFWYDRHWVASITKTFVATSIAILEDRDLIDSSRPIDYYLEELKDTEWQGTSIRNLLDMATGMDTEDVFADGYNMFEFFKSLSSKMAMLVATKVFCYRSYPMSIVPKHARVFFINDLSIL